MAERAAKGGEKEERDEEREREVRAFEVLRMRIVSSGFVVEDCVRMVGWETHARRQPHALVTWARAQPP